MKYICLLFIFLISTSSYACSCISTEFGRNTYKQAAYIVKGEVINIEFDEKKYQKIITFIVDESYKKSTEKTITIRTAISGAACGLQVNKNDEWLFFVYEYEGDKFVGLCGKHVRFNRRPKETKARFKANCKLMESYTKKLKKYQNE
tara:strand:+ start:12341 stop:12781 length:441 start_codon:yes stop_codon:yes gene_type:complete